jgi:uncharacterized membrane protein (DUF106 family)
MPITIDPKFPEKVIDEKLRKELRINIIGQIVTFVTAAFGIVAALAWNEAVKAWLDYFIKTGKGALAMTLYAVIVTVISVIAALFLGWIKQKMA